jgi:hypothetical protein
MTRQTRKGRKGKNRFHGNNGRHPNGVGYQSQQGAEPLVTHSKVMQKYPITLP